MCVLSHHVIACLHVCAVLSCNSTLACVLCHHVTACLHACAVSSCLLSVLPGFGSSHIQFKKQTEVSDAASLMCSSSPIFHFVEPKLSYTFEKALFPICPCFHFTLPTFFLFKKPLLSLNHSELLRVCSIIIKLWWVVVSRA